MITHTGHWEDWTGVQGPTSATIGVLDGVHRGHASLLSRLDPALTPTVLTFEPHPVEVLRPGTPPRLITTIEERLDLFESAGVQQVGVLDLAVIKEFSPERFVSDVLVGVLGLKHLVVGEDFRFGRDRSGDVALLMELGPERGFEVALMDLVSDEGGILSSSRIRALIESGDVGAARSALGHAFTLSGEVVGGDRRGREFGFPTANIRPPARKVIPAIGVYAAWALLYGKRIPAAVNVGVRPTFGGGELLIEAHLLDFGHDIYGARLGVDFVDYLRPEVAFDDVADLIDQMRDDVERTRSLLGV